MSDDDSLTIPEAARRCGLTTRQFLDVIDERHLPLFHEERDGLRMLMVHGSDLAGLPPG